MDVLEYWEPRVDWSQFDQGTIPDEMWQRFKQLVQLCHAHRYWRERKRAPRAAPQPRAGYKEGADQRRKRPQKWRGEIDRCGRPQQKGGHFAPDKKAANAISVSQ